MGTKLKKLCEYTNDEPCHEERHVFSEINHGDFPDERELIEIFRNFHEEFPDYQYFGFESEWKYLGCNTDLYTWWLIGFKE